MRYLISWLKYTALVLLVLLTLFLVALPAVFSSSLAVVYSGSMAPEMPVGALAWMGPVDPTTIEVGDIIAFNPPSSEPDIIVSHRVVEVINGETLAFSTKGDANEEPDWEVIPAENVVARVSFNLPSMGRLLLSIEKYTKGKIGFALFIALPTVLLIGSAMRDMNFMLSPSKRRARLLNKMMERQKKRRSYR
ncbi:signal peptidase I [Chloroflexota bacterium]